jgi:hypothetical protein
MHGGSGHESHFTACCFHGISSAEEASAILGGHRVPDRYEKLWMCEAEPVTVSNCARSDIRPAQMDRR